MVDFFKGVAFVVGVILVSILCALGLEQIDCSSYEQATGRETKMNFGCYIKDGDVWYSRKEFEFKQAGVTSKEN